jgi:hypothetical protein
VFRIQRDLWVDSEPSGLESEGEWKSLRRANRLLGTLSSSKDGLIFEFFSDERLIQMIDLENVRDLTYLTLIKCSTVHC